MGSYKEVYGNLITMALKGEFDVVSHGCNCLCLMGSGIAPQMAKAFGADKFKMESPKYKGDINKLGTIDFQHTIVGDNGNKNLFVVNSYTQYGIASYPGEVALDYDALVLCLKKINNVFKGNRVGLPLIGGGLAGGNPDTIKLIIKRELVDCDTTLVLFDPTKPECK